jgi:voltage-gated potassium channel Kch
MRKITLSQRWRYRFDNIMARGPIALIGWLFLLSALLVVVVALAMVLTGLDVQAGEKVGFGPLVWRNLMRAMDAGALGADSGNPWFLVAMFVVTIGGIFIVSILIGVLTSGIEGKLESLRKGRSFVVEHNHTVILNWSSQVFAVVSELIIANANQSRAAIVILAEKDKVEMEDELRAKIGSFGRTRIVCRSGSPADLSDLEIVNPHNARAIIVLAPETDNPDAQVIKTMLALTNNPNRRSTPYHIVSEIHDPKNMEVARMVGRHEAELILVGDLIARITVQTCRQSGLSVVYTELLDFGGDEIYFHAEPLLVGKTFREVLLAYDTSAAIGLRYGDGRIQLLPPLEYRLVAGDTIIAISADDDTIKLSGITDLQIQPAAISTAQPRPATPEHTLILGWNERAMTIITELNNYVAPGSSVTVVAEAVGNRAELEREYAGFANQTVSFAEGDITDRTTLDSLAMDTYQHVIVLSYSDELEMQQADSRTLITLLHLRDMVEKKGHTFSIVSEMLDVRNRELAEVTQADDFIVSDKLVGLMMSQVAENKELAKVFADLFDAEGSEIYLKPARDYVTLDQPLNFYTVVEAAARRGEIALGYRLKSETSVEQRYGVHLNPPKIQPVTFSAGDRIIILANA